jgi:hypothetical protein
MWSSNAPSNARSNKIITDYLTVLLGARGGAITENHKFVTYKLLFFHPFESWVTNLPK